MAIRKPDSYDEVKHLLMSGLQAECLRAMLAGPSPYPLRRKREAQLGWAETGPEEYQPYNVVEMHIHVGVKETELHERIEELERTVEQLRDALDTLLIVSQPVRAGLSREQRRKRLDVLFERAMQEAVGIEERYGDPVELLTTLLPLSEEEARKLERE